jgi:hypothetical protein
VTTISSTAGAWADWAGAVCAWAANEAVSNAAALTVAIARAFEVTAKRGVVLGVEYNMMMSPLFDGHAAAVEADEDGESGNGEVERKSV